MGRERSSKRFLCRAFLGDSAIKERDGRALLVGVAIAVSPRISGRRRRPPTPLGGV